MKKIAAIVGTNSKQSTNRDLLNYMKDYFKDQAQFDIIEIDGLPLFAKNEEGKVPELALKIGERIDQADGVVISTPEYNHSITSALTNALHWLSYHQYPLADKPVMITGASYGRLGSSRAQMHLRQILDSPDIRSRVMPNEEFLLGFSLQAFDEDGALKDPGEVKQLEEMFDSFLRYIDNTNEFVANNADVKAEVKNFSWQDEAEKGDA
ncbi:NADPH-dependent FMN reductase [Aerococcus sanguinicola]|uniref:NADPH-dependent FMN reductase n=1 Tax=Aerococcus sanguinicola TaxID=119206 RepID=UPI0018A7C80B|nr:NADPH-dependent FMN reductase [Aerococcus sanguinicola]